MSAKRALQQVRAPDEGAAEERAWAVVRTAFGEQPFPAARRTRWRLAIVPAIVAVLAGVALSPAGATVGRLIRQALGVQHAARALFSLPAPGRLLVSGPGGTWTVSADGSRRRLGSPGQASWSPHGLYIALARGDRLAVLDPHGVVRWVIPRPAVSDPAWYSPSGFKIAYLSGRQLRVVAGDGTGDHLLAANGAPVAPSWRPGHPYQLAYVDNHGKLVVRDADTRRLIWIAPVGAARKLQWSADGNRMLVLSRARADIYDQTGRLLARVSTSSGGPIVDGSLSPDGRKLALVRAGTAQGVAIANVTARRPVLRGVLSGVGIQQAVWAPGGRWLLIGWPAADQWVFVRIGGAPRIAAVSHIARQFGASSTTRAFPVVAGWCCTAPSRVR